MRPRQELRELVDLLVRGAYKQAHDFAVKLDRSSSPIWGGRSGEMRSGDSDPLAED